MEQHLIQTHIIIVSYNNRNMKKQKGKQLRKPVADNYAPKRLALNFEPPMVIMEYLVIDTGKLYHHKMRLDSILRKPKLTRQDVLNYLKTKHCLYFTSGKIKDDQVYKFIDKILMKKGLLAHKSPITNNYMSNLSPNVQKQLSRQDDDDDFDYLNDDEQYDEDYEDYQDPSNFRNQQHKQKEPVNTNQQPKNTFLTYCQQYQAQEEQGQAQDAWDLDLDEDADFV